jgi:predicted nucleic acid-binding protein
MNAYSFDTNIVIDALLGFPQARAELRRVVRGKRRAWISRMVWIEVMSKGSDQQLVDTEYFLSGFSIDEIVPAIASRAAALRRKRPRLKTPDAIILASAMVHGRVLVTRNTKDFPAEMPGIRIPYAI